MKAKFSFVSFFLIAIIVLWTSAFGQTTTDIELYNPNLDSNDKNYRDALANINEEVDLHPNYTDAWNLKGNILNA